MLDTLPGKTDEEAREVRAEIEGRIDALLKVLHDADAIEKDQLSKIHARCQEYQPAITPPLCLVTERASSIPERISERRELALIGDFLLRCGKLDVVEALVEESGQWLDLLLDVEIYKTAAAVEASVLEGNLGPALKWVHDHASKLRRLNSALEFFIRQEQYLNLVYRGRSVEALRFAQVNEK